MENKPILTLSRDVSDILKPIAKTSLKYTCFDVSKEFICLGASSGSIYAFERSNGKLHKFFGHKVDGIVLLKFSNDENLLAVADSTGAILCWEINRINREFKVVKEIDDFEGTLITAMCWNDASKRLFAGNNQGLVISFNAGAMAFLQSERIRKAGDPIVQMDCSQDRLVISSTTKSIVCFLERSQFHQIGTKPRDGIYGTCFMHKNKQSPVIYSARPGSRLWKVDFSGEVLATHQFKETLSMPPTPIIITTKDASLPTCNELWNQPQSFNFPQLIPFMEQYVLTWSPRGIYLIDPSAGSMVLWNDQVKNIANISCTKNFIYVLHSDGSLTEIVCLSIKECLLELLKVDEWKQIAEMACTHDEEILRNVEMYLSIGFHDVLVKMKDDENLKNDEIIGRFGKFIEEVDGRHAEIRALFQEKMNQMILNTADPLNTSSESGKEDSDELRSTASDGMSETSSKLSLSRLSEATENLVQKATSAVVSTVIKSGFMKKVFRDALESEGVILDTKERRSSVNQTADRALFRTQSVPPSATFEHTESEQLASSIVMDGSLHGKTQSSPSLVLDDAKGMQNASSAEIKTDDEIVVKRGRRKSTKKKKKAKVIKLETTDDQNMAELLVQMKHGYKTMAGTDEKIVEKDFLDEETQGNDSIKKENSTKPPVVLLEDVVQSTDVFTLKLPENAPTIVNKLANTTYATRNELRDAGILYNPVSFLDSLKSWSKCLNKVTSEFREECFRSLDARIQRQMNNTILAYLYVECNALFFKHCLHSAFGEVCNVAMLCLETNSFPDKYCVMKSHEVALLNTEITYDDIICKGLESIKKIVLSPPESVSIVEPPSKSPSPLPDRTSTPDNELNDGTFNDLLFRDVQDVKEILFDKRSLSTAASEPESTTDSSESIISTSMDVLVDNPLLCENFNLINGEACDQCIVDKCRSCFVLRHFDVLNFSRIRMMLSWSKECRWRTWLACVVRLKYSHRCSELLTLLQNATATDSSIANEINDFDIKNILACSSEIHGRSPSLLIECLMAKNLAQWEITLLLYTGFLGKGNKQTNDVFLNYANDNIADEKLDAIFVQCTLKAVLSCQPERHLLFCSCGQPRPGSNRISWKWELLLQKLVKNLTKYSTASKDKPMLIGFSSVCKRLGYWNGYLQTVKKTNENMKNVLELLWQLEDDELLTSLINERFLVFSEEDFSYLLCKFVERSRDEHRCEATEGWLSTMCVEKIVKLIAAHVGPKYALSCLQNVKNDSPSFRGVYTSLLKALQLSKKQDELILKLIEVASANVWSKSTNSQLFPHEFERMKDAELNGSEMTSSSIIHDKTEGTWGRNISISSAECPVCTLPLCLKSTYSSVSSGLIVFQCGHSFHKLCVPENACLVCYHRNFKTLS